MHKEEFQKNNKNFYVRRYDNWLDFVSHAEKVQMGRQGTYYRGLACASLRDDERRWSGTGNLKEAIELAYRGWKEGREMVRETRKRLSIEKLLPYSKRITPIYDFAGDEPDMDLYLRGEPEHMVTLEEAIKPQHGKVLKFLLNRSASCIIEAPRIVRKGVGLLFAFETLLQLGYAVDLTISETVSNRRDNIYEFYTPVLHAGDPVNLDTLAFMIMHPALLRRITFATQDYESKEVREKFGFIDEYGYGMPINHTSTEGYDLYLKWEEGLLESDEKIIPFALEVLKKVGVDVKENT